MLKISTTYVNRMNTNEHVFNKINTLIEEESTKKRKRVVSFVDAYRKLKWKRAVRIINQENTSIHKVSFENNKLRKWTHNKRRVGRPRANWTEETIKEIWDILKRNHERFKYKEFDDENEEIKELIKNFEVTNENCFPPPQPNP